MIFYSVDDKIKIDYITYARLFKESFMKKRIIFWFYIGFILFVTLVVRIGESHEGYTLEFMWAYRAALHGNREMLPLILDNLLNIVLFIPFGLFYPRRKYGPIFAFLLSVGIEFTQVFISIGFGDLDDVICNMIGGIIGVLIARYSHGMLKNR